MGVNGEVSFRRDAIFSRIFVIVWRAKPTMAGGFCEALIRTSKETDTAKCPFLFGEGKRT